MKINMTVDLDEMTVNDWGDTVTQEVKRYLLEEIKKAVRQQMKSEEAEIRKLIKLANSSSLQEAIKVLSSTLRPK